MIKIRALILPFIYKKNPQIKNLELHLHSPRNSYFFLSQTVCTIMSAYILSILQHPDKTKNLSRWITWRSKVKHQ